MKPLSLKDALKLHKLLEPYCPKDLDIEPFDFVSIIIENIKKSNQHKDYIDAIVMMSGLSQKALLSVDPSDVLEIFIDGIAMNNTMHLVRICRDIGLNNAR